MIHCRRCGAAPMTVLLAACAAAPTQEDHTTSLLETRDAWQEAIVAGDLERIFSFWTDDVVVYPVSEAPVRGISAVRDYVRRNREVLGVRPRLDLLAVQASESGDFGYTIGTHEWINAEGQATMPGRYVTLWRRTGAGEWKCFLEIHSPAESPVAAPASLLEVMPSSR